jgi:glycosyltransferase involved in cell wall biosynthesis
MSTGFNGSRPPIPSIASAPRVTVAVPSYNQGRFLEATLRSIFAQPVPVEVMLADGGSTDDTLRIIERWQGRLGWFRTSPDRGQASAINEAVGQGRAPLVCWLNSDDLFLPGGLSALVEAIESDISTAVTYGECLRVDEWGRVIGRYRVAPVTTRALSRRSVIAQPASIIRREAWERAGGLDENLHLSPDYDLWWRLHRTGARFKYISAEVAAVRLHSATKTIRQANQMYAEAKSVVRRHHGSLPFIWWLKQPLSIGLRKMRQWAPSSQTMTQPWEPWSMTSFTPRQATTADLQAAVTQENRCDALHKAVGPSTTLIQH